MVSHDLWHPSGDPARDYLDYKEVEVGLVQPFSEAANKPINLYNVEHVWWYFGQAEADAEIEKSQQGEGDSTPTGSVVDAISAIPDSYVPPIVSVISSIAKGDERLVTAAEASGVSLPRALERHVNAVFKIMGYETKLLGQGHGRVPDGLADAVDDNYIIIWDAKLRTDGYSMGTDDRTIREYINTQSRELKRRQRRRNIYYAIVSSSFKDDYDDAIRSMKMETDVNEVVLIEASALVAMVEAKLREPLLVTLGPDGLQTLFASSGVLTASRVREYLQ